MSDNDLEFWKPDGNKPPKILEATGRKTFCGAWHFDGAAKFIPPYCAHLKPEKMLEDCLIEGTFASHWETKGKQVVLYDLPHGNRRRKPVLVFEPDGKRIDWGSDEKPEFGRVLFALAFIAELRQLLLRGWKTTYLRRRAALNGRVKGRILVGQSIRQGAARGKPYITVCETLERSPDHPVNRIFRYTLQRCRSILQQAGLQSKGFNQTWSHLRQCDEKLASVSMPRHIKMADFKDPSLRGFYRRHGQVLALAKAVLRCDYPDSGESNTDGKVIPFLLYTPYLFEKWIAARALRLSRLGELDGWSIHHDGTECLRKLTAKNAERCKTEFNFFPDLVCKPINNTGVTRILDAKYKQCWTNFPEYNGDKFREDRRSDLHQILAYQAVFEANRVGLIYPGMNSSEDTKVTPPETWFIPVGDIDEKIKDFLK